MHTLQLRAYFIHFSLPLSQSSWIARTVLPPPSPLSTLIVGINFTVTALAGHVISACQLAIQLATGVEYLCTYSTSQRCYHIQLCFAHLRRWKERII